MTPKTAKNDGFTRFVTNFAGFVTSHLLDATNAPLPDLIRSCPEPDTRVRLHFRSQTKNTSTDQKNQRMKTSLQIRSLRAAGAALALSLGLAAASHSAQAATVQITLGGSNWIYTVSNVSRARIDVTGDGTTDGVKFINNQTQLVLAGSTANIATATFDEEGGSISSGSAEFDFTDLRINGGAQTRGRAQGVGSAASSNSLSVTLTRIVFDNASTTAPSFNAGTTYPEWSPTSTAVPEPGTFIPAAALVMGALLRRRRSRSHRSGRATA